jgi:hypothetical protein
MKLYYINNDIYLLLLYLLPLPSLPHCVVLFVIVERNEMVVKLLSLLGFIGFCVCCFAAS